MSVKITYLRHSEKSNKDCDHLVNTFEKLKISVDRKPEVIQTPYPGAFYRKTVDDGKIKVFQKGDITKIYMYPTFRPKCPRETYKVRVHLDYNENGNSHETQK